MEFSCLCYICSGKRGICCQYCLLTNFSHSNLLLYPHSISLILVSESQDIRCPGLSVLQHSPQEQPKYWHRQVWLKAWIHSRKLQRPADYCTNKISKSLSILLSWTTACSRTIAMQQAMAAETQVQIITQYWGLLGGIDPVTVSQPNLPKRVAVRKIGGGSWMSPLASWRKGGVKMKQNVVKNSQCQFQGINFIKVSLYPSGVLQMLWITVESPHTCMLLMQIQLYVLRCSSIPAFFFWLHLFLPTSIHFPSFHQHKKSAQFWN